MLVLEDKITFMEMTSPSALRPSGRAFSGLLLREVGLADLPLIRATHDRVAGPHDWESLRWSGQRWQEHLARAGVRTWIAELDREPVGLAQLQVQPGGEVEIEFFGLAPELIGQGLGGAVLTEVTRLAFALEPVAGEPIRRVWLRTSAYDHPHAVRNYRARGFVHYRTETRQREFTRPPVAG